MFGTSLQQAQLVLVFYSASAAGEKGVAAEGGNFGSSGGNSITQSAQETTFCDSTNSCYGYKCCEPYYDDYGEPREEWKTPSKVMTEWHDRVARLEVSRTTLKRRSFASRASPRWRNGRWRSVT